MGAKWGVYRVTTAQWLVDLCAGWVWSHDVNECCWFDSIEEAKASVKASDGSFEKYLYLRLK